MVDSTIVALEDLNTEIDLFVSRSLFPKSEGLASLENYLMSGTSISQEGIFSKIKSFFSRSKEKANAALDKCILKINGALDKVHMLNKEQSKRLALVKAGKLKAEHAQLPVSQTSVRVAIKAVTGIVVAVGSVMLVKAIGNKINKDVENLKKQAAETHEYYRGGASNPKFEEIKKNQKARNTYEAAMNVLKEREDQYNAAKKDGASPQDLQALEKVLNGLKKKAEQKKASINHDFDYREPSEKLESDAKKLQTKARLSVAAMLGLYVAGITGFCVGIANCVRLIMRALASAIRWLRNKPKK